MNDNKKINFIIPIAESISWFTFITTGKFT